MQKNMLLDGATSHISSSRGRGESTSVHSREPKTRVAEMYRYFVSKRFINHIIIIKS